MSMPRSLRARLTAALLAVVLLAACVQAVVIFHTARTETEALFDAQLQRVALSLSGGLAAEVLGGELDNAEARRRDIIVQIWRADGIMLYRSASPRLLPQVAVLGFSDVQVHGTAYRVYALQTPTQVIQVAQVAASRAEMARGLALRSIVPVALLAPLIMLVVWWVISRALAPLERSRQNLAARPAHDLSPLPEQGLPAEILPLVQEMNLLFVRLQAAWDALQHFVSDAAHELRTPLAALRLQVQSLARAPDDEARRIAGARVMGGIDRATRMVEQLLSLARQEAGQSQLQPLQNALPVPMAALCERMVGDWQAEAARRGLELEWECDEAARGLRVAGQPDALELLLRNLLENALRYTPAPGRVRVGWQRADAGHALLSVEDSGPGIAPEQRARVLDRFYRVPGTTAHGSGLGLAIVHAVARQHGAELMLDESPQWQGLRVRLRFALVE